MIETAVTAIRAKLDSVRFTASASRDYLALSDLMEFDHPITIHADGRITDASRDVYAPDLYDGELQGDGWELLNGYSGQDRYAGPVMHNSEFIGGRMAEDILSTPGTYVAVVGYWSPACDTCWQDVYQDAQGSWIDTETDGDACEDAPDGVHETEGSDTEGWAVARLVADREPAPVPAT